MGRQVLVDCKLCSYSNIVTIGGSRSSYQTNDPFPAFCQSCNNLTSINNAVKDQCCRTCGSKHVLKYGEKTRLDSSVIDDRSDKDKRDGVALVIGWDEGLHLCPNCKKYGLEFGMTIMLFD